VLNDTSYTWFTLHSPSNPPGVDSTLITVTHDLTMDGVFKLATNEDFGTGTYRLFNYGGNLTNNDVIFGLAPAGYNLVVNTDTAGQVTWM